jgi:cellulase/cellobiase CelA1
VQSFDAACGSGNPDATPGAPQAGQWFGSYFTMLAENAVPAL